MRQKIIIFALCVIVVVQSFLMLKPKEIDYSHFKTEINKHQERIIELNEKLKESQHEILRIKAEIDTTRIIIDNADKSKLREMSSIFK